MSVVVVLINGVTCDFVLTKTEFAYAGPKPRIALYMKSSRSMLLLQNIYRYGKTILN